MESADIYIAISRECPKPGNGKYIAVLEAVTEKGKAGTLTIQRAFEEITPHGLELTAIKDALHRFNRPSCVHIHSAHGWFKTITDTGWLDKWAQADFKKGGEEMANANLYRDIVRMYRSITIETIDRDMGTYKTWLESEIKNPVPIQ